MSSSVDERRVKREADRRDEEKNRQVLPHMNDEIVKRRLSPAAARTTTIADLSRPRLGVHRSSCNDSFNESSAAYRRELRSPLNVYSRSVGDGGV